MERFDFSSRMLPEAESVDATRDVYRHLAQIELEPIGGSFFSDLTVRILPGIAIARIDASPCVARRTPSDVADGNDDLIIQILTGGRTMTNQSGGEVMHLKAGESYLAPNECSGQSVYDVGSQGLSIAVSPGCTRPTSRRQASWTNGKVGAFDRTSPVCAIRFGHFGRG